MLSAHKSSLSTYYVQPEITVAMLPHWALSLISTLYGVAWFAKETDYIGAVQNTINSIFACFTSTIFRLLLLIS
jgi:hypothetical protein